MTTQQQNPQKPCFSTRALFVYKRGQQNFL